MVLGMLHLCGTRRCGTRRLLLALFVGHVMADGAATDRAKDAMVSREMASHGTYRPSLETARRFGWRKSDEWGKG
jgi:hypothetical protein